MTWFWKNKKDKDNNYGTYLLMEKSNMRNSVWNYYFSITNIDHPYGMFVEREHLFLPDVSNQIYAQIINEIYRHVHE